MKSQNAGIPCVIVLLYKKTCTKIARFCTAITKNKKKTNSTVKLSHKERVDQLGVKDLFTDYHFIS